MGVALIQFLKAFTPIVVTMVAVVVLGERPSLKGEGVGVGVCGWVLK